MAVGGVMNELTKGIILAHMSTGAQNVPLLNEHTTILCFGHSKPRTMNTESLFESNLCDYMNIWSVTGKGTN